jgi:fatty-acyl-CoA synthase
VHHARCRIVLPGEAFDPLAVLQAVQAERCTGCTACPRCSSRELDHPRFASSTCPRCAPASWPAPLPGRGDEARADADAPAEITIAYGMTETSPVSCQSSADTPLDKRVSTVGLVQPHLEIKIVDPDGRIVPVGERARFCTRGYSVMHGYWDDEEKTREAIDAEGWMHTGDLAVMDAEGYVQHRRPHQGHGDPRRREHLPARDRGIPLPPPRQVQDVQVVGVPDAKYGEELCAWIIAKPGQATLDGSTSATSARARSRTTRCRATSASSTTFP